MFSYKQHDYLSYKQRTWCSCYLGLNRITATAANLSHFGSDNTEITENKAQCLASGKYYDVQVQQVYNSVTHAENSTGSHQLLYNNHCHFYTLPKASAAARCLGHKYRLGAERKADGLPWCKKTVTKSKEVQTGCSMAGSSTEGHGSKGVVTPMIMTLWNDASRATINAVSHE
jgi:hypothetical protein